MLKRAWEPVIGLEVHVQLATESKAFSPSSAHYGAPANSLTDPTVLALPGSLPTFNRRALEFALRLGLATGAAIRCRSRFARKHYFYPDLPKGYQISQYEEPLCAGGAIDFFLDDEIRRVRLIRIHLEEDAGKNTHHSGGASLVDLNRAGVPLCEVVSEPDLRSPREAAEYMRALRQLVRYLGISHGDMEKGQLRCDANVSLRPAGSRQLGTRTELKNINSFRFVQRALEHEIERQAQLFDRGGHVVQETRLWDADAGLSQPMRGKEEAEDYRYFPDPDLPPLVVPERLLDAVRAELPELPMTRYRRITEEWGVPAADARTLVAEKDLADYYEAAVQTFGATGARMIGNWVQTELLAQLYRDRKSLAECRIRPEALAELVRLIDEGVVSGKIGKRVFALMYASGDSPAAIIEREGLRQVSDEAAIETIAASVVAAHPEQAEAYRQGKDALLGFFVGQVMKETRGQANPQLVNRILRRLLTG